MTGKYSTSRRQFMVGLALAGAMSAVPYEVHAQADAVVRPFKIAIPEADIAAMKRRITETRWADAQPGPDESQPVRFASPLDRHDEGVGGKLRRHLPLLRVPPPLAIP